MDLSYFKYVQTKMESRKMKIMKMDTPKERYLLKENGYIKERLN